DDQPWTIWVCLFTFHRLFVLWTSEEWIGTTSFLSISVITAGIDAQHRKPLGCIRRRRCNYCSANITCVELRRRRMTMERVNVDSEIRLSSVWQSRGSKGRNRGR